MFKGSFKTLLVNISLVIVMIIPTACQAKEPTAFIVDDQTGKPIEGAVAIAIWRGPTSDCTLIQGVEGGCWGANRVKETVSDKEGKIFIDGFWNWHLGKGRYPQLTVYKFGYVCWDQKQIFIPNYKWEKRTDFNKDIRIVRLKKWTEGFTFNEHSSFESDVTNGDYSTSKTPLFVKEMKLESPYIVQENKKKYSTEKK
jgi:hypothetical protein